jgi:hypothetical protein
MFDWLKGKARGSGPDFSAVDSRLKAEELMRSGELRKMLLMPLEFGGADIPPNVVFVPAFALEMKARIDATVAELAKQRTISQYEAVPEYEGNSFVPTTVKIIASNPGSFTARVAIWGRALSESGSSA